MPRSLALLVLALSTILPYDAAALTVTTNADDGAGSLRQALADANPGDTIDFALATPATITLANELVVADSVTITGPGVDALTIDADGASRVFKVDQFTTVTITDLTVANGGNVDGGGCIFNQGGDLTLRRLVVRQCSGNYGAGILNDAATNAATLRLVDSTVRNNQTTAASGGGIYNDGTTNTATIDIEHCTLFANAANTISGGGGAINSAFDGGQATMTIHDSTISGNLATAAGGGVFNSGADGGRATMRIANSTFAGNAALEGGAVANIAVTLGTAELEIGNTILRAGSQGGTLVNTSGTLTSTGFNLASDTADGDLTTGPGGLLDAPGDRRNTNPLLGTLQANGGPTETHALLTGSPAIDQGRRDTIAALADTVDQRGVPRPADDPTIANASGGDGSDVGAFEVQPPRDLAVTALKVPKTVTLKTGGTAVTKTLKVTIQNRGAQVETIPDLATLGALVEVDATALGAGCAAPVATLVPGKPKLPAVVKSKKKLTVAFAATFSCAVDPLKSTKKDPGHADVRWVATVHREVLGEADAHAEDDVCPRPSLANGIDPRPNPARPIKDKGCGGKLPDKTLGADVTTDVVVK